jgi:hypothetical protein
MVHPERRQSPPTGGPHSVAFAFNESGYEQAAAKEASCTAREYEQDVANFSNSCLNFLNLK